jgi:hypothetical protein
VTAPAPIDLAEYIGLAWNGLVAPTTAGRRAEAVASSRAVLTEAVTLPLNQMTAEETALALIKLRAVLAQLLAAADRTLTPPAARNTGGREEAEDLCAGLLDLIAATPTLAADITIHIDLALPADLIATLAAAIGAPGLKANGLLAEAIGTCGTSSIHVTAPVLDAAA